MKRYEVTVVHACGANTFEVEAKSAADARKKARALCAFSGAVVQGVRAVGEVVRS